MDLHIKDFFKALVPTLKENGMSDIEIQQIERQVRNEFANVELPRIALIGFTGVGKSSTINALFNAGMETSPVRACTNKEAMIYGDINEYTGTKGKIIVYDMPGLGEDIESDRKYMEIYKRVLPIVDVAVWIFHAGDRAMTPMQDALLHLQKELGQKFAEHLIFAINKADAITPGETAWDTRLNMPSLEQKRNMEEFENYVKSKINKVLPMWNQNIVSYSAKHRFRLDVLMTSIIEAVPINRRWIYGQSADVADFTELIDPKYTEYIRSKVK